MRKPKIGGFPDLEGVPETFLKPCFVVICSYFMSLVSCHLHFSSERMTSWWGTTMHLKLRLQDASDPERSQRESWSFERNRSACCIVRSQMLYCNGWVRSVNEWFVWAQFGDSPRGHRDQQSTGARRRACSSKQTCSASNQAQLMFWCEPFQINVHLQWRKSRQSRIMQLQFQCLSEKHLITLFFNSTITSG